MAELNPVQFTAAEVEQRTGYDRSYHGPSDDNAKFSFIPNYPLSRINALPASEADLGHEYAKVAQDVRSGRAAPIVVSDAARAPHAVLHDGWHRARLAKGAGRTDIPAYVRSLDE